MLQFNDSTLLTVFAFPPQFGSVMFCRQATGYTEACVHSRRYDREKGIEPSAVFVSGDQYAASRVKELTPEQQLLVEALTDSVDDIAEDLQRIPEIKTGLLDLLESPAVASVMAKLSGKETPYFLYEQFLETLTNARGVRLDNDTLHFYSGEPNKKF